MIKIIDTDQFALQGTNGRFIHLATINHQDGRGKNKDYIYFHDMKTFKRYCQEISMSGLGDLPPEDLLMEIEQLLFEKGISQTVIIPGTKFLTKGPELPKGFHFL